MPIFPFPVNRRFLQTEGRTGEPSPALDSVWRSRRSRIKNPELAETIVNFNWLYGRGKNSVEFDYKMTRKHIARVRGLGPVRMAYSPIRGNNTKGLHIRLRVTSIDKTKYRRRWMLFSWSRLRWASFQTDSKALYVMRKIVGV